MATLGALVQTLVEKREEITVTKWTGGWDEAVEIVRLWPEAQGFKVIGDTLHVLFADELQNLIILRGTYIQVKLGFSGNGPYEAVGLLECGDVYAKWQPKSGVFQ